MILEIIGMRGAGKSTVTGLLREEFGTVMQLDSSALDEFVQIYPEFFPTYEAIIEEACPQRKKALMKAAFKYCALFQANNKRTGLCLKWFLNN